jgi:hypothetical protein
LALGGRYRLLLVFSAEADHERSGRDLQNKAVQCERAALLVTDEKLDWGARNVTSWRDFAHVLVGLLPAGSRSRSGHF